MKHIKNNQKQFKLPETTKNNLIKKTYRNI